MSTQILYLEGKAKWAKVYPGQEDVKYGKKASIDLYPTAEAMILFKTSGSRKEVRTSEDGDYIKFDRDVDALVGKNEHTLGYPEVVRVSPDTIRQLNQTIPFSEPIGNGSDVVLKVAIYDSKFGKGTRLEGVNVINLVPYEGGPEVANPDNPYKF